MIGNKTIERIQASGFRSVWAVTGGGIAAVHAMLVHPGASRFVLDVRIPYSAEALEKFLGDKPVSACSEAAARLMAAKALESGTLGVACTAALQTNRARKGADRAYICIQSLEKTVCKRIDLEPGTRAEQDTTLSEILLTLLADFVGEHDER
ncbi:CinA family protein [Pontiella sp. NLcol2]|uniref:CinA family protein n=2 Tax=Pontiella agarivorans TaxID=3038953 RepID=A0ABU5N056_9BACT|nr:CinA family protein [Pontiella agarivorans]